jgi:hypothetical protein
MRRRSNGDHSTATNHMINVVGRARQQDNRANLPYRLSQKARISSARVILFIMGSQAPINRMLVVGHRSPVTSHLLSLLGCADQPQALSYTT